LHVIAARWPGRGASATAAADHAASYQAVAGDEPAAVAKNVAAWCWGFLGLSVPHLVQKLLPWQPCSTPATSARSAAHAELALATAALEHLQLLLLQLLHQRVLVMQLLPQQLLLLQLLHCAVCFPRSPCACN